MEDVPTHQEVSNAHALEVSSSLKMESHVLMLTNVKRTHVELAHAPTLTVPSNANVMPVITMDQQSSALMLMSVLQKSLTLVPSDV